MGRVVGKRLPVDTRRSESRDWVGEQKVGAVAVDSKIGVCLTSVVPTVTVNSQQLFFLPQYPPPNPDPNLEFICFAERKPFYLPFTHTYYFFSLPFKMDRIKEVSSSGPCSAG